MKLTRKVLSILLIVAMLSIYFVGSVSAAEPVTVQMIDESGNLSGSKIAPDGMPSAATDIDYLSDRSNADAVTGGASYKKNQTYSTAVNMVYLYPNRYLPKGVTNSKGSNSARVQLSSSHTVTAPRKETVYGDTQATEFVYQNIYMGGYAVYYEKGLGVHAAGSGNDLRSLIFSTQGADYFYAVAGGTGSNITNPDTSTNDGTMYTTVFKVYGSNAVDGTFELLAQSDDIYWWYTAEFNVDISAYSYIKLEVVYTGSKAIDSCAVAWGNACVYNLPEASETNVRFVEALSLLKGWKQADLTGTPAKAVGTYNGTAASTACGTTTTGAIGGEVMGIPAKGMTDEVTVYLADSSGNRVSSVATGSIYAYAIECLEGSDEAVKALAYNLLQYGAAAQTRFNYNTTNLASAGTGDYSSYDISNLDRTGLVTRSSEDENNMFYATNLRLKEQVNLMFYFKDLPEGSYAKFTVGGKEATTVQYAQFMDSSANGVKIVELTELAAAEYKEAVTCTIYNAEGQVLVSATDSVAGYAFRAIDADNANAAVCEALLAYSQAAAAYEGE